MFSIILMGTAAKDVLVVRMPVSKPYKNVPIDAKHATPSVNKMSDFMTAVSPPTRQYRYEMVEMKS